MGKFSEHGVLERFVAVVKRNPEKLAVQDSSGRYSYRQLSDQINIIACHLISLGVKPGEVVAVSTSRHKDMVALLMAIWSIDATYLPLDPLYPVRRKTYILEDADVRVCIVDDQWLDPQHCDTKFIPLSELLDSKSNELEFEYQASGSTRLAYIIYTSGSTGNPKGVKVSHGNLTNFLRAVSVTPGMSEGDHLLAITTISFDIHILELFLPLFVGASLFIANSDEVQSASKLRRIVDEHGVNFVQATPAVWRLLLDKYWLPKTSIKALIGGEAFPPDLLPLFIEKGLDVWNMYGPTETTVWSLCHQVRPSDATIYIGEPISNTCIDIVDDQLESVERGGTGELLIGGLGVTQGYLNKPDLTRAKFIQRTEAGETWYRTGDLVRDGGNGLIEYIERIDNLIKLRGHRIEPREVETIFSKYPGITQAILVVAEVTERDRRLVLFYTGENMDGSVDRLQDYIAQYCPYYMVPQYVFWLDKYIQTDNLKIDRTALAQLAKAKVLAKTSVNNATPRNLLERSVAEIWAEALQVSKVGIDDDFFELGGDSVSAILAVEQMNSIAGVEVSVADLFAKSTIKSLLLDHKGLNNKDVVIIALNKSRVGTPCFALCGVKVYQQLANLTMHTGPFYGVFANQEIAYLSRQLGEVTKMLKSDRLVEAYADAIAQKVKGLPKVILMGFSFGGVMAVEVAKLLVARGLEVEMVVLIDSYSKESYYFSVSQAIKDIMNKGKTIGYVNSILRGGLRVFNKLFQRLELIKTKLSRRRQSAVYEEVTDKFEMSIQPYTGKVLLIKSDLVDFGFGIVCKEDYGWRQYATGPLHITSLPYRHESLLLSPAVISLSSKISQYLKQPEPETEHG